MKKWVDLFNSNNLQSTCREINSVFLYNDIFDATAGSV